MRNFIAISTIFAFMVSVISSMSEPWDECGMTEEAYIGLTNRIDSAIMDLVSRDVRIYPARKADGVDAGVERILNADIASMDSVQVKILIAHEIAERPDVEVSAIYAASIVRSSIEQLPKIMEAVLANATQTQIAAVFMEVFAQVPETVATGILEASLASGMEVQVSAALNALFALKTEVEIRRILSAAYAGRTGIDIIDYLDNSGYRWLVSRMKAAKSAGNEELYLELRTLLLKSINDLDENPRNGRRMELSDPEL